MSRIDEVPDHVFRTPGRLNSTWGGNLVDMMRGARYLEIIRTENLVANAARQGERLLAGLQELAARYPVLSNVRGRGLMTAFSLPSPVERDSLRRLLWDKGLATLASWPRSIRFRPCLNVSADEVDEGLSRLEAGLREHVARK